MKTKNTLIETSALSCGVLAAAISAHASSDYGPAIWNPPSGCTKYYSSGYGHKFHVIHDMEGYYLSSISLLRSCSSSVSVHYACNGKHDTSTDAPAGELTQMVLEANYAWHVCCWNKYCTGCEHEGFASNPAWYTEAMYQASSGLSLHEANKFGFAKDRNHIVGHDEWMNSHWTAYAAGAFGINTGCNTHHDPGTYWDWSHYMALVTGTGSNPGGCGVCSRGSGLMDVFTRSAGNQLWKTSYSGGWSAWQNLGDTITSDPAAASPDANTTEVFWANNGTVYHKTWTTTGGWSATFSLPGLTISGSPAVCSRPTTGTIDVYARGTDNALWKNTWTGSSWSGWSSLGETVTGDPAVCAKGANELDVFWKGSDNGLWKKTWTTTGGWSATTAITGMTITWGPGAVSKDGTTVDVVVRGTDTALYKNTWSPSGGWSGFQYLGGSLASSPDYGSSDPTSVNAFYRGMDGNIYEEYWQASCNCWDVSNLGHE